MTYGTCKHSPVRFATLISQYLLRHSPAWASFARWSGGSRTRFPISNRDSQVDAGIQRSARHHRFNYLWRPIEGRPKRICKSQNIVRAAGNSDDCTSPFEPTQISPVDPAVPDLIGVEVVILNVAPISVLIQETHYLARLQFIDYLGISASA